MRDNSDDKKQGLPEAERPARGASTGARWWRDALVGTQLGLRRYSSAGLGLLGGSLALTGCYDAAVGQDERARGGEVDRAMDTRELQRQAGWNVGQPEAQLSFPGQTPVDVAGGAGWSDGLEQLTDRMRPADPALAPYYVPTLFQSLIGPSSFDLRAVMTPILTPEMRLAYERGQALLTLFEQAGFPPDTALVLDLPGPESVAVASAVAGRFAPVFTFDNWPHPLGVVPSHLTLGAVLYSAPIFEQAQQSRPAPAPPALVLDAWRLAPYTDEDTQFDNRYTAKLPTAEGLAALGIHHVLYVTAGPGAEADDLNEVFVSYAQGGVEVKSIALSDFQESSEPPPEYVTVYPWPRVSSGRYWYYGGSWGGHLSFWRYYGWHRPVRPPPWWGGPRVVPPPRVSGGFRYVPAPRPTLFHGLPRRVHGPGPHVVGAPPAFGHVTVRTSRRTGVVIGVRPGRSGSFGRFHGGYTA
jgi:hypothetical protein